MHWLNQIPLLHPAVRAATLAVALLAITLLWWWRGRALRWPGRVLSLVSGVTVAVACWLAVDVIWAPFAEPVGLVTWVATGVGALAITLVLVRPRPSPNTRAAGWLGIGLRILRDVAAAMLVLLCALISVNGSLGAFPTFGDLFGTSVQTVALDTNRVTNPIVPAAGQTIEDAWRPPDTMPTTGTLSKVAIAGTGSHFSARDALVYLPPAYHTAHRPLLPVLVMMAGQPGEPAFWVTGGNIVGQLDQFAAQHAGLAPIVVIADPLGMPFFNPLCSNTAAGNVATYLEQDVPAWVDANLQASGDHTQWGVGGLSNGGTCALQLATRRPDVYPTFLDMSGEIAPDLGGRQKTIRRGFGNNLASFQANNPADLMAQRRYPQVAGIFSVGDQDRKFAPAMTSLHKQAQDAGMNTQLRTYRGTHSWRVWSAAFADQLDWLATRFRLTH